MLKQFVEEDFYQIETVAKNRLRPDKITGFFWLTLILSGLMTLVTAVALDASYTITNPIWSLIYKGSIVLLLINLLVAIFFTPEKNAYKFQRIQGVLLSFFGFKLSIDFYPFYFLAAEDKLAPSYMNTIGILAILGGLVITVLATIRSFHRVKQGELRVNGKGLYNFKQSKGHVSVPIVFGVTMMGGAIAQLLSDANTIFSDMTGILFVLLLCVLLQYSIALVWPEFLLLAYSKCRFGSFCIPMQKRKKLVSQVHTKGTKAKR